MVRQRVLTMPQSLRVAKCWYRMVAVVGGAPRWTYWSMNEIDFQVICGEAMIHELMEYPAPYARNSSNLKTFLKCVVSYLSRGHFEGELDEWLNNPIVPAPAPDGGVALPPGGGLGAERDALIASKPSCEGSSVTVMIMKAKEVLMTLDYMETKMYLGEKVVEQFNVFNPLNETCDGLRNAVIRGNTTKAEALEELSNSKGFDYQGHFRAPREDR